VPCDAGCVCLLCQDSHIHWISWSSNFRCSDKFIFNVHQKTNWICSYCVEDFFAKQSTLAQTFVPGQLVWQVDRTVRCLDLLLFREECQKNLISSRVGARIGQNALLASSMTCINIHSCISRIPICASSRALVPLCPFPNKLATTGCTLETQKSNVWALSNQNLSFISMLFPAAGLTRPVFHTHTHAHNKITVSTMVTNKSLMFD